ncbi:MAG: glutamate/tyrosine decarboxylase-like PLP-dependent enzyme, partial [Candidatus Azotimanducaceae bacterium]
MPWFPAKFKKISRNNTNIVEAKTLYPHLKKDQQQFPEILEQVKQQAEQVISSLGERAAGIPQNSSGIGESDYFEGIGAIKALERFQNTFADKLSGSAGPNYFGFVTGGSTPASVAGDWLTSIYDQNVMGSNETIAADFEVMTLHMLRSMFHLSEEFEGSFVSGATMSNFTSLAIARQWLGQQKQIDIAEEGIAALGEIKLFSAAPHSSIYKSLSMLGIGRKSLTLIPTLIDREAIDVSALEVALKNYGKPCIVVASAGTVNTVDFDDLVALSKLRDTYSFWLHVDAAFGGFAACSKRYRDLLTGINEADSITIDAHKWLNVPYDSAMQFSKHLHLQTQVFQNSAAYLRADLSSNNFINLTPENSRRFRALATWFSLVAYGKHGYSEIVERACGLASWLA